MVERITLDREALKALASDTRLDILKRLDEQRRTVTELARDLGLNKATVFEHCERLLGAELIQKVEDDRKWVYYQLSWKGRRLLHPETMTIALLLSSSLGAVVTAAVAFWVWASSRAVPPPGGGMEGDARIAQEEGAAQMFAAPLPEAAAGEPAALLWAVGLLAFAVLAVFAAWAVRARARRRAAA